MTRPSKQVEDALALHAVGRNNSEISRILGIPRCTVRDWIKPRYVRRGRGGGNRKNPCFRCLGRECETESDYVYLLGLYLGDGCISATGGSRVWRLRIFQDMRYSGLISECRLSMSVVAPTRVLVTSRVGCVEIGASWKHWVHVLPQHGRGPKWLRPIALEHWQKLLVERYPAQLVRGLIHSDGCRSLNTVHRRWQHSDAWYSYPRYQFTNASDDIRLIFTNACDRLGVRWTQTNARNVAISRKPDVEFLDRFIGPKR